MNPTTQQQMLTFLEQVLADLRSGKRVGLYSRSRGKGDLEISFERASKTGHLQGPAEGWQRADERRFQLQIVKRSIQMLSRKGRLEKAEHPSKSFEESPTVRTPPEKKIKKRYVPVAERLRQMYPTIKASGGSVWTVSGGLPSLGKRR